MGRDQGWLAEHMLILGVTSPTGKKYHVAAAFPSACGKTNFAMLVPPKAFEGWKVTTIGDDIAWIKPGKDGRLVAINPESGYFGVAPGTNDKTNPNCMASLKRDVIFTNVALTDDGDVWWEGMTDTPPAHLIDWQGKDWTPAIAQGDRRQGRAPERALHGGRDPQPGARQRVGQPGRRGDRRLRLRRPPLHHRAAGDRGAQLGRRRVHGRDDGQRDHRGDGRRQRRRAARPVRDAAVHGLPHGRLLQPLARHRRQACRPPASKQPHIFCVNWFRKGADGKFVWPGYGENMRVLKWMLERVEGRAGGVEHLFGISPRYEDITWDGLNFTREQFRLGDVDRSRRVAAGAASCTASCSTSWRRACPAQLLDTKAADRAQARGLTLHARDPAAAAA